MNGEILRRLAQAEAEVTALKERLHRVDRKGTAPAPTPPSFMEAGADLVGAIGKAIGSTGMQATADGIRRTVRHLDLLTEPPTEAGKVIDVTAEPVAE